MKFNIRSIFFIALMTFSIMQSNAQTEFWRKFDDVRLEFRKAVRYAGDITPDTLDASANNYTPTDVSTGNEFSNASVVRLRASTAVNLTGLAGGSDGRVVYMYNIGSQTITFKDESGSSTAANRFALSADVALAGDESIMLQYDATASRWRMYNKSVSTDLTAATSVSASWSFTGDISPTSLSTSQNNYDPTSLSGATIIRLTSSAAVNITGLAGGADGRMLTVCNIGSFPITLKNESGSSTAANRFTSSGDYVLNAKDVVNLSYDATSSRWRIVTARILGEQMLGKLIGADLNVDTTDQAITINYASKYVITKIVVTNASADLSGGSTAGGVYPSASQAGTAIVANSQVYTALSASTKFVALTLASITTTDVYTGGTIYFNLTTAFGSACTADIYVYGYVLTQ